MGDIVLRGFCALLGKFALAVLVVPAALLFGAYLVYIAVMTLREFFRK